MHVTYAYDDGLRRVVGVSLVNVPRKNFCQDHVSQQREPFSSRLDPHLPKNKLALSTEKFDASISRGFFSFSLLFSDKSQLVSQFSIVVLRFMNYSTHILDFCKFCHLFIAIIIY